LKCNDTDKERKANSQRVPTQQRIIH